MPPLPSTPDPAACANTIDRFAHEDAGYHHDLKPRQMQMIAIGGAIGTGLFLGAGELLMRAPGIVGLHTLTSTNALHYGYQTSGVAATRAYLLLQAGAFLTLFRDEIKRRGGASSGGGRGGRHKGGGQQPPTDPNATGTGSP